MTARVISMVALAAFLWAGVVNADEGPRLPGSAVKEDDSVAKCPDILIGTIIKLGAPDMTATRPLPGPRYPAVEVKVTKTLWGTTSEHLFVTIQVSGLDHEAVPGAGDNFIFFLQKDAGVRWESYTALKLLPAIAGNIARVKKLISN